MEAGETAARWAKGAFVLSAIAFAVAAYLLIVGHRPWHVWLTLCGTFSTLMSLRALRGSRASAGQRRCE